MALQFLCRKFLIFSEFLFDDYIKSRLMKAFLFVLDTVKLMTSFLRTSAGSRTSARRWTASFLGSERTNSCIK